MPFSKNRFDLKLTWDNKYEQKIIGNYECFKIDNLTYKEEEVVEITKQMVSDHHRILEWLEGKCFG